MLKLCKSPGAENTVEITSEFALKLQVLVHSRSLEEAAWLNDGGGSRT